MVDFANKVNRVIDEENEKDTKNINKSKIKEIIPDLISYK